MLASFVLSLLAGFLTTRAEPLLEALIRRLGKGEVELDGKDLRILGFGLILLVAATIVALLGADGSAWLAIAGGLLGYFGLDLYAIARDPHGASGDRGDDWDGELAAQGQRRTVAHHAPVVPAAAPEAADAPGTDEEDPEDTLRAVREAIQAEPSEEPATRKETDG